MESKDVSALIKKLVDGNCSPQEQSFLEEWYTKQVCINGFVPLSDDITLWEEAGLQLILSSRQNMPVKLSIFRKYKQFASAAILFLVLSVSLYFLIDGRKESSYGDDVAPGKTGALLTLANGQKISLTNAKNGELAKQSGVLVTKTQSGQVVFTIVDTQTSKSESKQVRNSGLNTIETPLGEEYMVRLPDKTTVWLNAGSAIKFPSMFAITQRRVELSGEAYFEVAKDKAHPFVVKTKTQEVTVLGTHFNINSYSNESTEKTTLLEGSVKVTPSYSNAIGNSSVSVLLRPNEQASNDGLGIKVKTVYPDNVVAWKNGEFIFNNDRLDVIMRRIARWYNVTIVYKDRDVMAKTFAGQTSKYTNISDVLCILELTGEVQFRINGKEITVMR